MSGVSSKIISFALQKIQHVNKIPKSNNDNMLTRMPRQYKYKTKMIPSQYQAVQ